MTRAVQVCAAVALCAAAAAPAAGQPAAQYRRTSGDTLRYHNTTKMDGMVRGAAGDAPFTLTRDATFAFAFSGGDNVVAWYDALAIDASGALGGEKSNPEALIHAPFRLHMETNGHSTTVRAPELPRNARLIAELPPAFDDFFPRLPKDGNMRIGATWADTSVRTENDTSGHHLMMRRISYYRALRDSVIGGKPVVVISQHTDIRINSSMPMQQQPYIAALALTGDEDGTAVFCVAEGRMLARERKGELRGAVTYKGGDEPWVVNQTYHYHRTDTLDRVKP